MTYDILKIAENVLMFRRDELNIAKNASDKKIAEDALNRAKGYESQLKKMCEENNGLIIDLINDKVTYNEK